MRKKLFTAVIVLLLSSVSIMGQMPFQRIEFKKVPQGSYVEPVPPIFPMSVTITPMDGTFTGNEILITCTDDVANMEIIIVGKTGIVFSQKNDITIGEEIVISTTDWDNGSYTIYVVVGEDVYVGDFEK